MADPAKETDVAPPPTPPPPQQTETMVVDPATAVLAPPPPLPAQETEAMGGAPATANPATRASEPPAAVVEPVVGEAAAPPPPPQVTEPTDGVAPALDPALPTAESARRAPPREEPEEAAAGTQPPTPPMAEQATALPPPPPPPPSEAPSQETVTTAVEAEKQVPAAAAPPPPQQQPPQLQEGGAAGEASSVHGEEKDAAPAVRAQEGEEKPEEKHEAQARVQEGRRRWRRLQAVVRLIFLRCKEAPPPKDEGGETKTPAPGGKQKQPAAPEVEETKPTLTEGEKKPSAPDGKQPAASGQEPVASSPPLAKTPSPERAATATDAEKPLVAPPQQQQQPQKEEAGAHEQASVQEEEKDAAPAMAPKPEGEENPARRRWRRLRAAVRLLFLRPKSAPRPEDQSTPLPKDKEGEPSPVPDGTEPPASGKKTQAAAAAAGETKSQRRAESQAGGGAGLVDGTAAAKMKAASWRFQKVGKRLLRILSWYRRHRSPGADGEAAGAPAEEGKAGDEIKPATALDGDKGADDAKPAPDGKQPASGAEEEGKQATPKKPHPKWPREEERLEEILEDAFTRLLAAEFHSLSSIRQKCLLTFSVFELASEVKKQGMVYWWVSEFSLRHRSDQDQPAKSDTQPAALLPELRKKRRWARRTAAAAGGNNNLPAPQAQGKAKAAGDGGNPDGDAEGIFSELSSNGFLEPMKNWCSRVIHGCKVNPLVHWMVKRRARDDRFADLDVNGNPATLQPNSSILCLTVGNRPLLQKMRMEDESQQQAENKPKMTKTKSLQSPTEEDKAPDQATKNIQSILDHEHDEITQLFKGKRVILNVNAHVYPISKSTFSHLSDCLVVLQLGRWCNVDDNTYMEVDGLESLDAIGSLKNLRYLSLRGLSRLTEVPKGIQFLKKLLILDMRGCQNLVNIASKVTAPLTQLTHLDLTECYMLEYISRGITYLSELQVFKGFVFATGTQGSKACRLQDLRRLKKLQKLTVSITTDANVRRGEMAELKHLASLRKLTITWSKIPSILDGVSDVVKKRRDELVEKWTSLEIPPELLKLDIRCYPKKELTLKVHKNLKKLYLRGGDLERFSIEPKLTNSIKTLRLRYLKNFNMEWEQICSELEDIEYVEIVPKDEKVMKDMGRDQKDENMDTKGQKDKNIDMKDQSDKKIDMKDQNDTEEKRKLTKDMDGKDQKDKHINMDDKKDIEEELKLVNIKKIIYSKLDENGVWVKDEKEENQRSTTFRTKEPTSMNNEAQMEKGVHGDMEKSKGL